MARLDGYVADIEYIHHFSSELGPSALNFALTMQGIEPVPLGDGFSCCDLGCGQGISTNVFAACHPEGQFHAIDFNHAHILGARELASQAGLHNATFWEATFDDIETLPLPEFDFITLHGVYSWVNADNRKRIVDFIQHKLKPGGVVYVSYNCLPGWSLLAPVRQLLIASADMESELIEEQINASISFVDRLKSMNLSYFSKNPSAISFFESIKGQSRNYLAHEYFNKDWVQFYHADVANDFSTANLTFAGSVRFADNLDFLRFSQEEQLLLNSIENSVLKETVKDFAANTQFRRDVFTHGRKRLHQTACLELVSKRRFALVVSREKNVLKLDCPRGDLHFDPALYESILNVLDVQCMSLDEMLEEPDFARFGFERIHEALMVLLAAEHIMPAVNPSAQAIATARLFNYALLERMAHSMEPYSLASPVVQSGIQIGWVERLLLLCELTGCEDPLDFVSGLMRQYNCALIINGVSLQSWEENMEELGRQIKSFHTCHLPLLKRLGVV